MLLNDLPETVRNGLDNAILIEMLTAGVNATVDAYYLSYERVTGESHVTSFLYHELNVRRLSVTTPDGYTFFRLSDGTWGDSLNPECCDMTFPSDADLAESWFDDSVRALELIIEAGNTFDALDFERNSPDCEHGREAAYREELQAELAGYLQALRELK